MEQKTTTKQPTLLGSGEEAKTEERGHQGGHLCEYAYGGYSVCVLSICLPEFRGCGGWGVKKKHVFVFTDG